MALARTTLSAAIASGDIFAVFASITGLQVGMYALIDQEMVVVTSVPSAATLPVGIRRGVSGGYQKAHPATAGVTYGTGSEFQTTVPGAASIASHPTVRNRIIDSYSATGAIAIPSPGNDAVAILNGTVALAMTLANPGKDNDGDRLTIIANGKAAHTVTPAKAIGDGGSNLDLATFAAGGQNAIELMAANETWVMIPSFLAGTLTNITVTMS